MSTLESRIEGALIGAAIGDAMGATTEFMTDIQICNRYGQADEIIGGGWLGLKPGQVTDDTQMSMCVMDALMHATYGSEFIDMCGNNFIKWYMGGPLDVGTQCAKGINYLQCGQSVPRDNQALGNGSLMRALPCAIVDRLDYNIAQGRMTHNNATCDNAIRVYHVNINAWLSSETVEIPTTLLEPTGCVVNTLNNALYYASHANSFEDGIVSAVNNGGDADTIASIAGGLLGARFGLEAIPQRWINKLEPKTIQQIDKFVKWAIELRKTQA